MKNINYQPYLVAIVTFLLIAVAYCFPVLDGKVIEMGDITKYKGQAQELTQYEKETGEKSLWTNSMFSGMPSYLIKTPPAPKFNRILHRIINLNDFRPVSYLFLYMLGFYIALLCFRINPWLSIVGAVAYAFSTFFFIIIPAGHSSKAIALGYMPAIIGGIRLAFSGKRLTGSVIFAVFFTLQLLINHLQITYYTFIIVLLYSVTEFYFSLKEKRGSNFFVTTLYLLFFAIVAIGCNFKVLWTTYEYGNYSIRGKSELTANKANQTSGLDKDYATDWSYGISESFTLLIPNFMGGPSSGELPRDSETYDLLVLSQGKAQAKKAIKRMPTYWGDQPFTSGPVYAGAIICLFFVLGLFIADKKLKWWLLITTIVSLILAWGRNVPAITNFLLDYLPGYNKFRAVSTTMVIAEFTMPLLAFLALAKVFKGEVEKDKLTKSLLYSFGITGGLTLFFIMFGKALFTFEAPSDQQYLAQGADQFVEAWQADRFLLLRRDAFRSFIFIGLATALIFLYSVQKIKLQYAIAALGLLILFDMWPIDKRYFNNDNFISKRENKTPFTETPANKYILNDNNIHYRVLNLSVSPFQDASTSYFHKSIGGYHGAKMRRYQELYEQTMFGESQRVISALQSKDMLKVNQTMQSLQVLNMLNTKYIIINPNAQPLVNTSALGNAWFVSDYKLVKNADEEIAALKSLNTREKAIIDQRFSDFIEGKSYIFDSTASIKLDKYNPNYLKYSSSSASEQLAVFSEIYYPKGWIATIDGEKAEHFRANYILRAMTIPAGEHTVEFKFEPQSYYKGGKIAAASSWILFISLLTAVLYPVWQNRRKKEISENKKGSIN